MKDYGSYSFWLETSGDDLTPRPRLDGSIDVDVAVMGAGYTGLWTAYYLLLREPSLRVAVVEREIAGFGASGRNGGWCYPGFPVSASLLRERYGTEAARAVSRAMVDTVDEIERVLAVEQIDAQWARGGVLRLARGEHQRASIEGAYQALQALGLADRYQLLDASQTAERVRVTDVVAALHTPVGASVHPARLARGLARAVERHGGTIYEQTPVVDYEAGPAPRLITPYGDVRARTIVLAGEAYSQQLPEAAAHARAHVLAHRPHRAPGRERLGPDWLAQPGADRLVADVGRLPQSHGGWTHPVRGTRRAVSHALACGRQSGSP